ncbi:ABC transporter substrate-binding protein [Salinibacterium hongtaonis]|uniref:Solute-binding protein family 5 domain-containing protein n=1 Tax=Homoserinimonas hongtaonis TaxID=2079791 RepID=A0A2U1T165_9MICO|nr:ABC transporter substrate-binding protein [Salinibacterium hongtaonis]PWB97607.1 hypothetical protein DF220_07005 [Salinibacterium hongtaonis]
MKTPRIASVASVRHPRRIGARAAALAVVVTMGLAGCTATAAVVDPSGVSEADKRGGELIYLDAEIPTSAQVHDSGTWQTRALQQNITDRLIYRNAETGEFEPWLAESWEVSADGTVYTFVIREGVTYSDGSALDVASVKRNLEWQAFGDPEKAISPNPVFPAELAVTTDAAANTVTVTLAAPYAPLLGALTGWASGLVADATIDATREDQSLFVNLIGSGPFVVESEVYGKEVVLKRRDGYAWAPPSSPNQGEAYLDKVIVTPIQEDSVRLGSIKSGQADLIRYVQPTEEDALADQGFHIVSRSGVGLTNQWIIKQSAPFLDDVNVRKALQSGINRAKIAEDLYTDNWSVASSVLSPGTFGYKDESALLAYDPAAAIELLEQSGWTALNSEGYRIKGGETLSVLTYLDVYDNTSRALFQAIQVQLAEIGIELVIKEIDYSSYWATAFDDPEVGVLRVGWPHPDPIGLNEYYAGGKGGLLALDSDDAQLDALLAAHVTATDDPEREAALGALQDYLIGQAYVLPILDDSQVYVAAPRLQGFTLSDGALPQYYNAWIAD